MKPMFEASIRRVTVTVKWAEGPNPQKFEIVQYVTNPQRGGFAPGAMLPGMAGNTPGSVGGTTGAPPTSGPGTMGAVGGGMGGGASNPSSGEINPASGAAH
jgi:hypothetical protein